MALVAQRRWVATLKAAKPNGAQHEQYSGDIHLVDWARGRAPTCGGSARRAREADRPDPNWPAEYIVRGRAGKQPS